MKFYIVPVNEKPREREERMTLCAGREAVKTSPLK